MSARECNERISGYQRQIKRQGVVVSKSMFRLSFQTHLWRVRKNCWIEHYRESLVCTEIENDCGNADVDLEYISRNVRYVSRQL